MRIAIVGAGIAGLGSAWLLQQQGHAVTLFEAGRAFGGHTATVDVTLDGRTFPVDTGFLVFNDRTYPRLARALRRAGRRKRGERDVVLVPRGPRRASNGRAPICAALFAQPRNALRPAFWRMLADILRFNRATTALQASGDVWSISLGEYLDDGALLGAPFRDWYLLPMAAAIWSSPRRDILDFPLPTFVRFCHNHGLLQIVDRPQWRTVAGGARTYVERIVAQLARRARRDAGAARRAATATRGGRHATAGAGERFDEVVLACHSDQARALLADRIAAGGSRCSASVRYQPNRVRAAHRRGAAAAPRGARGRRGTTSPPTIPTARGRSRCRISSTSCSRCRAARR